MDEYTPKLTQAAMERKTGLKGCIYVKGVYSDYSCSFEDAQIVQDLISVKDNPDGAFEIIETITIKMPRTGWRSVDETKI